MATLTKKNNKQRKADRREAKLALLSNTNLEGERGVSVPIASPGGSSPNASPSSSQQSSYLHGISSALGSRVIVFTRDAAKHSGHLESIDPNGKTFTLGGYRNLSAPPNVAEKDSMELAADDLMGWHRAETQLPTNRIGPGKGLQTNNDISSTLQNLRKAEPHAWTGDSSSVSSRSNGLTSSSHGRSDEITFGTVSGPIWDQYSGNRKPSGSTTNHNEEQYAAKPDHSRPDFEERERLAIPNEKEIQSGAVSNALIDGERNLANDNDNGILEDNAISTSAESIASSTVVSTPPKFRINRKIGNAKSTTSTEESNLVKSLIGAHISTAVSSSFYTNTPNPNAAPTPEPKISIQTSSPSHGKPKGPAPPPAAAASSAVASAGSTSSNAKRTSTTTKRLSMPLPSTSAASSAFGMNANASQFAPRPNAPAFQHATTNNRNPRDAYPYDAPTAPTWSHSGTRITEAYPQRSTHMPPYPPQQYPLPPQPNRPGQGPPTHRSLPAPYEEHPPQAATQTTPNVYAHLYFSPGQKPMIPVPEDAPYSGFIHFPHQGNTYAMSPPPNPFTHPAFTGQHDPIPTSSIVQGGSFSANQPPGSDTILTSSALDLYRHLMEAHASEISKEIDNFLSETIAKGSVNVGIIAGTLRKDSPMAIGGLQDLLQTCLFKCTHESVDSITLLRLLQDICSVSESLPPSFQIDGVSRGKRFASGAEAAIYHGVYKGAAVVVKECHLPGGTEWSSRKGQSILCDIRREIITHRQLHHDNILQLIGVYYEEDSPPLMVMPYMEHRAASRFLQIYGDPESYIHIITGAAHGLAYLHSRNPPVIHGDLHDSNILVNIWGKPSLCDFGFSRIRHEHSRTLTSIRAGGQAFFVAPEISSAMILRPTEASDIYSFTMTIYELGTKKDPNRFSLYHGTGIAAVQAVMQGRRPHCPFTLGGLDTFNTQHLYNLLNTMWGPDPRTRRSVNDLAPLLGDISTRLEADFQKSIPSPYPGLLLNADFLQLWTCLVAWYNWEDAEAGVSLIKSFDPSQRQAIVAGLVISAMSTPAAGIRRAHVNHITSVAHLVREQRIVSPALLYLGLLDFFSASGPARLDGEALRDASALLLASGVSRLRVAEMCWYQCTGGQALMERWDALFSERYQLVNSSAGY